MSPSVELPISWDRQLIVQSRLGAPQIKLTSSIDLSTEAVRESWLTQVDLSLSAT